MRGEDERDRADTCDYYRIIRASLFSFVGGFVALACLAACSSDPDPNKPVATSATKVGIGTCLLVPDDIKPEISDLPTISCAKPHTHEVFAVYHDTEDDVFPGVAALVAIAKRECYKAFEDWDLISAFDSSLLVTWIVPGADGWNLKDEAHDDEILCLVRNQDGSTLTGTTKGSKL